MPFYRYEHDCGLEHTQFLKVDKESVVLTCLRCGRGVTARQVRDKAASVHVKNEVRGVFRHDNDGGSGHANSSQA
jgi:hypothetical protein